MQNSKDMYLIKFLQVNLAILFLLAFSACPNADDDGPIGPPCEYLNYVVIDGECTCPEGYIELGDEPSQESCIEKRESLYSMTSNDCSCGYDFAIGLAFSEAEDDITAVIYHGGTYENAYLGAVSYTPKADGDEIYIYRTVWLRCADGEEYDIEMSGKFNEARTEMHAEVVFYDLNDGIWSVVDSCTYFLTNQ